jgi:hypothetical protein
MTTRFFKTHEVIVFLVLICIQFSCNESDKHSDSLFQEMDASQTGIDFVNKVEDREDINIFNYRNFYNGGGVSIGDINNDGLPDIYFTANMGENKLYLNKGNWKFEDITAKAGVGEPDKWSTGVVMADVNGDNLLDIYVCNAGYQKFVNKQGNSLYINNGNLTFTESAKKYGLDETGYTTHAAFLDYDLDGDLDAYILNNSFIPVNTLNYANDRNLRAKDWPVKDFLKGGGAKLLRNDSGKFIDVSDEAGIYGSLIGFGLGVTVGDINGDLYPDIYICNDFYEKDYLYINRKDGTFSEELEKRIKHTSLASMGADMADINNDGYPELFVTDMLPRDEYRYKTTTSFENHYLFNLKKEKGFYNQYMQNSLQFNNQDGTFSEIANYSGVAASDWSWGALLFDADNDSKTDIYVCNGIYHDILDQDFIDFFANEVTQKMVMSGEKQNMQSIIDRMPSTPIANNFFHNEGNLQFSEKAKEFGFGKASFSNGAAYADLDNDGDLDLVVNNVNEPCFVYKNRSEAKQEKNHYVKFSLKGEGMNTRAIGSKVEVYAGDQVFSKQVNPSRGFQSSTEYPVTIGLGKVTSIDSVRVIWPSSMVTSLRNIRTDTLLSLAIGDAKLKYSGPLNTHRQMLLTNVDAKGLGAHQENRYEDFYNERNIPVMLSQEGPKAAIGDVNGDELDDIYMCGAKGQGGQLYLQKGGQFVRSPQKAFSDLAGFEDTAALFFDADGDGDHDLAVGSGGNESLVSSPDLPSRLYLNDGKGNFALSNRAFPPNAMNTAVISPCDYDGDGDLDVFAGSRSVPREYGTSPRSYLYQNDGKGNFKDVAFIAPELNKIGMVRDANWADVDGDGQKELIIVGDWMAPAIFKVSGGNFKKMATGLEAYAGFWGSLKAGDLDGDGDQDLVLGNIGGNFSLKASANAPLKIWINDFNKNGTIEKVISKTSDGKDLPVLLKREMTTQFPFLKKKGIKHSEYAVLTVQELFPEEVLKSAVTKSVTWLQSGIAVNDGKGKFRLVPLPYMAQFSCLNAVQSADVNHDGKPDLIVAGNFTHFIPQLGSLDACRGNVLINKGNMQFDVLLPNQSGFALDGEVKQISPIDIEGKPYLISLVNNAAPVLFKINKL